MTAIWKTGTGGTSEDFDINISCDKKFYWVVVVPIPTPPFYIGSP